MSPKHLELSLTHGRRDVNVCYERERGEEGREEAGREEKRERKVERKKKSEQTG